MRLNTSAIRTSSDGAWQGDNPLNHALPLLIVQTILVVSVSRTLAFLLRPLRQPKVVAEIIGGILLGPSAIGRNKKLMEIVFPSWSTPILESVASLGLLFYLFLVGLELDIHTIRRSGKPAFNIAAAGITLPFLFAVGVTFLIQRAIHFPNHATGYVQHFVFLGVSLSITAFPVLARILAELKLLTTRVGETAMAAAAFNDVAAWVLLALAVALTGGGHKSSFLTSIWVLLSGVAFVALMMILIRPAMNRVAGKYRGEHDPLHETYLSITLAGVMLSGLATDMIGIHSIFGGFIFGLTVPKGSEFASKLTRRIEDFVSTLLLPLYFACSGLKTDVTKLQSVVDWGILLAVISTACVGKILGTFAVAVMGTMPVRESLTLGFLMNTKGLVELIVLNIGREKKVLNDEMFTILVLMALFTTFITTPVVLAIYKPSAIVNSRSPKPPQLTNLQEKLRILACIHGTSNIPSLINFIESIRATNTSQLKLYVMQLTELTNSSSSILMVQRSRKNGFPFINRFKKGAMHEHIATAFQAYGEVGQVTVHHLTSISLLTTMHEDICHVAEKKGVAMIIMPFHKRLGGEDEEVTEDLGHGWKEVNQRVLQNAPCSVAVLVNRGVGRRYEERIDNSVIARKRVCIIFIGGPHDRKVLELGSRIAEHPAIRMSVVRFTSYREAEDEGLHNNSSESTNHWEKEKELDEEAVNVFKTKWLGSVEYIEKDATNVTEELLTIGKAKKYELVIVGKQQQLVSTMLTNIDFSPEHAELGPIGDLLTSSGNGITSSVLVIQDTHFIDPDETTLAKTTTTKSTLTTDISSEI
ncbi:cation/H(+) antiporter 20-like [Abrus precatorius]|uniref:Cation/H(+) antiporter 20-like n=1 Tax=Abrus precatorius TaxID=3816 RepID=A0A8B8L888_ABRPR|nr:cation/H(+) antiporter 20-like [Abrus precatorius]